MIPTTICCPMSDVTVLSLSFNLGGGEDVLCPALIRGEDSLTLVDCGCPGFLPLLEEALGEHGLSPATLTHAVITHQDHDHMGALAELREKYPHILVAASREEAPYISARRRSLRLIQAEALQPALPEEEQSFGLAFCAMLEGVVPVPVDMELEPELPLPWNSRCTVWATPGHTPGHISLFLEEEGTLIAGDAAVAAEGRLIVANPGFALDLSAAEASLARILSSGAGKIICYHGGLFTR